MKLKEGYSLIETERGGLATIHTSFSQFPEGIQAHYQFYKSIMLEDGLPLERPEREFLAVEVSKANSCPYCIAHHSEALKNTKTNVDKVRSQALVSLADTLTKEPWKSSALHSEFLESGFTESQWQHAIMVVSYFNFVNRCAHARGLEIESNYESTCS
ncbi:MAG: carboxymuconolactone decarboxylase family protein [Bdellovibrionales bacterium]|nr:carboxymuconolactone decarboxylase family protein [Bdellovibrionales bacterium]